MNKKLLSIIGIIVLVIVVIFLVQINSKHEPQGDIKIGFFGPLSGETAPYGEPALRGLTIAAEEINQKGGINGRKVVIIAEDSKCSGKDATTAVQKLINVDHVDYFIGGSCSSEVLAVTQLLKDSNKLLISPFASSPQIAGTGVFRVVPSDDSAGPFMANFFIKKYRTMAIITEETDYGTSLRDALIKSYTTAGGTIVSSEGFISGTTDYRTILQKIKATNPDILFINPQSGAAGARIAKQARELGITTQFASYFITGNDFISEPASNGTILFDIPSLTKSSESENFTNTYITRYGKPSYPFAAGSAYDILHVLKNSIEKVGTDNQKIRNYLTTMSPYTGLVGTFSFNQNGDTEGLGYTILQVENGKLIPKND